MRLRMLIQFLKLSYRVSASLVVMFPIILNVILKGNMVASLLYIPIISLTLAVFFIHVDKQFVELLTDFFDKKNQSKPTELGANKACNKTIESQLL